MMQPIKLRCSLATARQNKRGDGKRKLKSQRYFEFIWSESQNNMLMAGKKMLPTFCYEQRSAECTSLKFCSFNCGNNLGCAKDGSAVHEFIH